MMQKVTITYTAPGLQPPVYIATSLSEPQWEPLEMGCAELPSGEREFVKTFHVLEGKYQYKFRLGPGDWWVCDEEKPTVADGFGDRNNVLVVQAAAPLKKSAANPDIMADESSEVDRLAPEHTFSHEKAPPQKDNKRDSLGDDMAVDLVPQDAKLSGQTEDHQPPLFAHERLNLADQTDSHQSPLLAHEQNGLPHRSLDIPPEDVPVNFSRQDTQVSDAAEANNVAFAPGFDVENDIVPARTPTPGGDAEEGDMELPPLMKHESLSPTSTRRQEAPDAADQYHKHFNNNHSDGSPVPDSPSHIPAEADPNDLSLERFPTHHEGIISSLRRASLRMGGDVSTDDVLSSGSPISKARSVSSLRSTSLPSVHEDDEEEEEGEVFEKQASKVQGFSAGLHKLSDTGDRPAALITPPHTPDESKAPSAAQMPVQHDHHHKPQAEKDMREEATHDVSHCPQDEDAVDLKDESGETSKPTPDPALKSFWGGMWESALGLGLTVLVGAGAVWLAFRMQDSIKDGRAVLKG